MSTIPAYIKLKLASSKTENNMDVNENGKVKRISFGRSDTLEKCAPSLIGLSDWVPNYLDHAGLSILTGVNGCGKSQLLTYLAAMAKSQNCSVVYVDCNFRICEETCSSSLLPTLESQLQSYLSSQPAKEEFLLYCGAFHHDDKPQSYANSNKKLDTLPANLDELKYFIASKLRDYGNVDASNILSTSSHILKQYFVLTNTDLGNENQPMTIFHTVFEQYLHMQEKFRTYSPAHHELSDFYKVAKHIVHTTKLSDTEADSAHSPENINAFKKHIMDEAWGQFIPPWEEVDGLLAGFYPHFKHKLVYTLNPDGRSGVIRFSLRNVDDGKEDAHSFCISQLSSGEQLIICLMAWQFCQQGFANKSVSNPADYQRTFNKAQLILLDEPDKHLDPKLCSILMRVVSDVLIKRNNAQVVIATHRLDTVTLAADNQIFVMHEKKTLVGLRKFIALRHKMLVMARLAGNIRGFLAFSVKVYTEAFDDALFYQNIYRLLAYSDINKPNAAGVKYYSQRWFPQFYSVCFEDGSAGGSTIVVPSIMRDMAFNNKFGSHGVSVYPSAAQGSFGLLDDDGGHVMSIAKEYVRKQTKHKKGVAEVTDRLVCLKRHSLENYIYDPFFLSSVLTTEQINVHVGNSSLRAALLDLKSAVTEQDAVVAANGYLKTVYRLLYSQLPVMQVIQSNLQKMPYFVSSSVYDDMDAQIGRTENDIATLEQVIYNIEPEVSESSHKRNRPYSSPSRSRSRSGSGSFGSERDDRDDTSSKVVTESVQQRIHKLEAQKRELENKRDALLDDKNKYKGYLSEYGKLVVREVLHSSRNDKMAVCDLLRRNWNDTLTAYYDAMSAHNGTIYANHMTGLVRKFIASNQAEMENIESFLLRKYNLSRCNLGVNTSKLRDFFSKLPVADDSGGDSKDPPAHSYAFESRIPTEESNRIGLLNHPVLAYYDYPRWYLETRGHNIESVFTFVESSSAVDAEGEVEDARSERLNEVVLQALINHESGGVLGVCIPKDLAEVLNELSNKIRSQVNLATNKHATAAELHARLELKQMI